MMKEEAETLIYFEVTTDELAEHFEERFGREPTDEEIDEIVDCIGDLATVIGADYWTCDVLEAFDNAFEELGFKEEDED